MSFIYVTEPDTIDIKAAANFLSGRNIELIPGDINFRKANYHPYETLLIRSQTSISSDIKKHFPDLKNIVRVGTGLDNIDLEHCKANNINIFNAAGANADAVSEYVVATALYALRKLHTLTKEDVEQWNRFNFRGHSMSEQTVGIIGFGNIGKLVYKKLHAFSPVKFLAYDPFITQDMVKDFDITMTDLDTVLKNSTLITLHLPLLPQTKYLINEKNFHLIQDGSLLINSSRGGIVDEQAAINYAPTHNIMYIADTVEGEPRPSASLVSSPNTIVTPHIASLTKSSEDAMLSGAINNFLDGKTV